jgi:hypothetical protein
MLLVIAVKPRAREGYLVPSLPIVSSCLLLLITAAPVLGQTWDQPCSAEAEIYCHPRPTWKQRWDAFWQDFELQRSRVAHWPDPFLLPDRELVREPLRQMAENGWKEQNTFSHYLFSEGKTELNYAGHQKLRRTLTQLPPHRRTIFVLEGATPDITAGRVASIYRHMAEISRGGPPYPVFTTSIPPRGMHGSLVSPGREVFASPSSLPVREDNE